MARYLGRRSKLHDEGWMDSLLVVAAFEAEAATLSGSRIPVRARRKVPSNSDSPRAAYKVGSAPCRINQLFD